MSGQSKTKGRGPGRPPVGENDRKDDVVHVGVSVRDKSRLIDLARGRKLSTYLREAGLRARFTILAPNAMQAAKDFAQIESRLGLIIVLAGHESPLAESLTELRDFAAQAGVNAARLIRRKDDAA